MSCSSEEVVGKLKNRCFFLFPAAILVSLNMASPYKALLIWVKLFSEYLAYEILDRPDFCQGFFIFTFFHLPDSRLSV